MIWIVIGVIAAIWIVIVVIAITRKKAAAPPAGGAAGTTPPAPTSRIPDWLKLRELWTGALIWLLINGAVWFFHYYTSQYVTIHNPWPLFLAVNVVAGLWILAILRGTKGGGKFVLILSSLFLLGVGVAFYGQSPTEFKAQAAANETRLESQLPRSGEKVIEAPVSEWSEFFVFPLNTWWFIDQGVGRKAELRDGLGKIYRLDGI